MRYYKRAPALRAALWLGLFFYLLAPLGAQEDSVSVTGEVSADATTLWVEEDGSALYWHSGLALTVGEHFFMGFDVGQVSSSLPWLNGSVLGFVGHGGIDMPGGGLTVAAGSLSHSLVSAAKDKVVVSNDGGDGIFISMKAPLCFGPLSIAPFVLTGKASWDNGDLYWFFGKPNLPSLWIYGADIALDRQDRYQHGLRAYGFSADLEIVSNEDEPLFNASLNVDLFCYQFSWKRAKINFAGSLGWFFAKASLEGALNTSNQPYFLFPYLFYDINAIFEIQAGFAGFHFQHRVGIFQYGFNLGVLHIFHDRGGIDIHYRRKRLFGGKEVFDTKNLELKGLGAAFLVLEAGFPALPLARKPQFSLTLQKAFAVPWGYKKLLASDDAVSSESPSSVDRRPLIKSVLLSGLSIRGSLSW